MKKKYAEPGIRIITVMNRNTVCLGSFVDVQSFLGGNDGSFSDDIHFNDDFFWGD